MINDRKSILVVDDDEINRRLLTAVCTKLGHETRVAVNGREAIEAAGRYLPDLILMDVMMPEMDGFEATERLKGNDATKHIPVIILTALNSREDMLRGIAKGANDFLTKPIDSQELTLRVLNNLKIKEFHDFLKDHNAILKQQVAEKTAEIKKAFDQLDAVHEKVKSSHIETIQRLTLASEYKDEDTGLHIKRISHFTRELAFALGMDSSYSETLYHASPMHDLGKVGIPDNIILKPSRLIPEEWDILKTHTTIGAAILMGSGSEYLRMGEEIARSHHERWDGGGYPGGLKGEGIPMSGRITNLADQYDALRSKRPYKPALDHETVVKILTEGDGRTMPGHFDPGILDVFKRSCGRFREIYESFQDTGQ